MGSMRFPKEPHLGLGKTTCAISGHKILRYGLPVVIPYIIALIAAFAVNDV
jgi:hypothetical protein